MTSKGNKRWDTLVNTRDIQIGQKDGVNVFLLKTTYGLKGSNTNLYKYNRNTSKYMSKGKKTIQGNESN